MRAFMLMLTILGGLAEAADYKVTEPDGRIKAYVEDRGNEQVIRAPDGKILGYADERRVFAPDGRTLYYLDEPDRGQGVEPRNPKH